MPLTTRRGSWLGRPVRGFSGGSSGSSRCHCASVTSKRLISPTWAGLPQSATLCRHALDGVTGRRRAQAFWALVVVPQREVECIDKAHKPYEFGDKVIVATPLNRCKGG